MGSRMESAWRVPPDEAGTESKERRVQTGQRLASRLDSGADGRSTRRGRRRAERHAAQRRGVTVRAWAAHCAGALLASS